MQFDFDAFTLVVTIVSLLIGLSFHEAMHAFAGLKLGDTTAQEEGRISFNPLRHIDPLTTLALPVVTLLLFHVPILAAKPVPFDPRRVKFDEFGAAIIAAAGPLTNLVLAAIGGVLVQVLDLGANATNALGIFTVLNVGLFVFNMVPIPPLDGSRVLYAFAPDAVREVMARMEQIGLFIVFGLMLFIPAFSSIIISVDSSIARFLLGY
jgi:Zn-dependent protease